MSAASADAAYDVAIVGAGAAGATAALLLVRAGVRVALVRRRPRGFDRPAEICSPATRRLMRALQLPMPDATDDARVCRGVLSTWESSDPQFYDYGLLACEAAIAIDRSSYDEALVAAARTAGAAVICGDVAARVVHHRGNWTVEFDRTSLLARWLIDASGRGGGLAPTHTSRRCFSDRLVACVIRQARCAASGPCSDVLLLAAVRGGWWYVSQSATGAASVVYLTDADLLPRSAYARSIHLGRAFDEASLLQEAIGAAPAFSPHRVVDARTSHRLRVGGDGWMAIGDAALSVDPLSGEGLRLAIASAARACDAITDGGRGLPAWESLAAWYGDQRREQRHAAAGANAAVVRRFADDLFWRRRDAVDGLQPAVGPSASGNIQMSMRVVPPRRV